MLGRIPDAEGTPPTNPSVLLAPVILCCSQFVHIVTYEYTYLP